MPGEELIRVHAEGRARAPEGERVLLAVVVHEHAVAAIERAFGDRVKQAEGRNHGTSRQDLDLEIAAGHVVHLLREVERVLVEDVLRRPGALPAQAGRTLRLDDGGEAECGSAGGGRGRTGQELTTRIAHCCVLLLWGDGFYNTVFTALIPSCEMGFALCGGLGCHPRRASSTKK